MLWLRNYIYITLKFRNFYVEILDVKCLKKVLRVPKDPQNFTNWYLNIVGEEHYYVHYMLWNSIVNANWWFEHSSNFILKQPQTFPDWLENIQKREGGKNPPTWYVKKFHKTPNKILARCAYLLTWLYCKIQFILKAFVYFGTGIKI